jgi:hypothetical protein
MSVNNMNTNYNTSVSSTSLKFYTTEVNKSSDQVGRKMNKTNSMKMYSTENRRSCKGSAAKKSLTKSLKSQKSIENAKTVNNDDEEQDYEDQVQPYQTEQPLNQSDDLVNIEEHQNNHDITLIANDAKDNDANRNGTENIQQNNQIDPIPLKTPQKEFEAHRHTETREEIQMKTSGKKKSAIELLREYSKDESIKKSVVDLHRQYSNYPLENENDLEFEQDQGREVIVENYDDKGEHY